MRLVIVSGQSGAGKSIALRVLEDLGYYCVDNLPVNLLDDFISSVKSGNQNVAVSLDIRNLPDNIDDTSEIIARLKQTSSVDTTLLFLDANKETLLKRYSETRRIHPLSRNKTNLSLDQAIELEKSLLSFIKDDADLILDSSSQSLHDLSQTIRKRIEGRERQELVMVFESFGFKYGLPNDADYV
ncbi:RNase adaptor protein RapZ, partial [Vibrio sp.]|nr:RNase adaptor protein RapZ [Vibrio sp.]